jgi:hypothetical protein
MSYLKQRSDKEVDELEIKLDFIKTVRGQNHSSYKQSLAEFFNTKHRETIDFEYKAAVKYSTALAEQSGLISK